MKSKKQEIMTTIWLILLFLQGIFGEKEINNNSNHFKTKEENISRKLQTDNYITLNFGDNFITDTCWFLNFDSKISSVEIDDVQSSDYTSGISLTSGNTMKIHFNSNLDELKYFLGYNSEKNSIYSSNCQNSGAFTLRSHITSIDLSHLITESITTTSNMFNGFSSLKIVNLEGFDASSLVAMDYMFSGCSSLHTIQFSFLTADGVTNMEGMFNGCSSLESVSLSKITANQVQNMKYMFNGCSALKKIDLIYINTPYVDPSNMDYIFNDCTSLVALYITNFYMSQISTENHMFDNVNKLKYIDIEYMHKFHTSNDNSGCDNEVDCVWPLNFNNHLIVCQDASRRFILNSNVIELCCSFDAEMGTCELDNYITVYYKEAATYPSGFSIFNNNERENKIDYINYNNSTFLDINELNIAANSKIDIQMNLDVEDLIKFFMYLENDDATDQNMIKVISIDLSHFNSLSITDISYCFCGCKSLEFIDFTNFNTENLLDISHMFEDCHLLKSIDLSSFDTQNVEKMNSVFKGCKSLEILDLSNFITESVTEFDEMFSGCESLKFLDISNFVFGDFEHYGVFEEDVNLKYINAENVVVENDERLSIYNENDLIICQNEGNNFVSYEDNIFYFCCSFNTESDMCESNNYIEIYYNEDCTYAFNNDYRNDISFINYNDKTTLPNVELNILAGTKLQINFDTPLTSLEKFFSQDEDEHMNKVVSIDFSHFDSSALINMDSVFYGCSALKSLNLSTFQTTSVTTMNNLFYNCASLEVLDISNFNMAQTTNVQDMFFGINNLIFINLYNTQDDGKITSSSLNTDTEYLFYICQENEIITNLNSINCCSYPNIASCNAESNNYIEIYYNEDCTYAFNNDYRNDISFINYNDKTTLPNVELNILAGTKLQINFDTPLTSLEKFFSQDEDEHMNKVVSIDFSHFDSSALINMDSVFYGCSALKSLNLSTFQTTSVTTMNNLFYNCASLEVLDISNFNMAQTTNVQDMFFGINNLIFINLYNTQDDGKITSSSLNTDTEYLFYICQENEIITNLNSINCCSYPNIASCNAESKAIAVNYNSITSNIANKDFKILKIENSVIQFSTLKEQMANTDNAYSSIDLGDCENKIRQQEGLSDSEEFLIVKVDIKNSTTNDVYVQYEIYNPNTNAKVPLEVCENDTIKIQVPVSLTKEKLSLIESFNDYDYNIFDLEDDFYNDVCTKYTAENGADMVLSSRKNLVYDKLKDNYYCQKGCDFGSLDTKTSKAECLCQVQKTTTITDISEISFDKKEFFDGFYSTLFNSNFRVFKCIKLLFSIEGIKSNYGFYSMTFLLASFITFVIIHIKTGYIKIIKILKTILKIKVMNEKQTINNIEEKKENNEKNNQNKEINKKTLRRKTTSKLRKKKSKITKVNELQTPPKRNLTKIKSKKKSIKSENQNIINVNNLVDIRENMINTIEEINKKTIAEKDEDIKEKKENQNNKKTDQEILNEYKGLTDVEMNDLDYEVAIVIDKRTYCQLYISLIKKDHLIIFTFFNRDDYNLIYIKIILFIVSFALFFAINAFFFTDETMNNIYEDNGVFNFIFQIPQILYSSLISSVINIILQKLSISEGQILDMKKEKDKEKAKKMAYNIRKNLKLKLIIFLVLSSVLILVFWYFISCFCCVYKNTQLILIQDTLISFLTSMIYPFIFKLFPGMFRIPALRAKKRDEKCKYKIGKILNLI